MIIYYATATVLAIINLMIHIFIFENKKTDFYYLLLMLIMAISNIGFLSLGVSQTLETAVLANKIAYIGGCFTSPLMISLICSVCNYKFNKWLRFVMYIYCFGIYALIVTSEYNHFYYTKSEVANFWGATTLVNEYGPAHDFFYVILYGTIVIQISLLIYSFVKKRSVSRRNLKLLIGLEMLNVASFFISMFIHKEFEIMPALYVLDGWVLSYIHHRTTVYNIEENVAASFETNQKNGYILFDNNFRYLGCNKVAEEVFPALTDCYVDLPLKNVPELEKGVKRIADNGTDAILTFRIDDRHFEGHTSRIIHNEKEHGFILELVEDTEKWKNIKSLSSYNTELEGKVAEQTNEIREKQKTIEKLFIQTVTALSEAVDAKDRYTSGHSKRVAEYSRMIAARMGKSKEEQDEIYRAGLLHDVGKIRIPVEIINKAGKLTDEEYNIIKIHSVTGYHILRGISGSSLIALAAKYHHERYDGKGYPNGLVGEKIPEAARILGVADSYDAMTSNRSYRKALPQDVVRSEIEKGRGTQFDPEIADIMLEMIDADKEYTMKQDDVLQKSILTVDDEPMNNKIIAKIMSDEPMYKIISAGSGNEALGILEKEDFDLILLDVMMPEMDGLETLRRIREKYDTPVVLMTADKSLDTSTEFNALGCDDFVTKPFLPLLIKEVVHNMTERTSIED